MEPCLLSIIVIIQSVSLLDGLWLGNNKGQEENIFIKPFLQETSLEYRNRLVNRSKLRDVLRHIFSELQDIKKEEIFSPYILPSEQRDNDMVEIERK